MTMELRAHHSRPSYTTMLELLDDEGKPLVEDAPSGSSFEPEKKSAFEDPDAVIQHHQQDEITRKDVIEAAVAAATVASGSKGKGKEKAPNHQSPGVLSRPAGVMLAPGPPRPSARQFHAPSLPSVNHRHRGIPLYLPPLRTLRLINEPDLFSHAETVVTRSISESRVGEQVAKALMYNVGEGPIWELMEDRSWFKECDVSSQTRPIVYKSLRLREGWKILTSEESSPYLPHDQEGSRASPLLECYFGPFSNQRKVELKTFETLKNSDFFPESKAHIFHAGAPVWAIDWCPVSVDDLPHRDYKQYLAVAPFPNKAHSPEIGRRVVRPSPACLQIWSLSPASITLERSKRKTKAEDPGVMTCEIVLCIDCGPAHDLKWCPLPAHDEHEKLTLALAARKLGVLAGTFEDGSLSLYVVPDPRGLPRPDLSTSNPIFVKLDPHVRIELEDTSCWSLDWANSTLIAVGCTNGSVAVFDVGDALKSVDGHASEAIRPTHYIQLHQSAVRAISWVRAPPSAASGAVQLDRDPTVLVSGGYDGSQIVTDIRDRRGNIMNRTRDVIHSIAYSHHTGGPLITDNENTVKSFSLAPTMLGRGHAVLEPFGPVWSIATSDFHPQVAVGSADGLCQTTNLMKAMRKGGAVPFFIYKIFQMDYSRTSGEFRMLQNFLPYEHQDRPTAVKAKQKKGAPAEPPEQISTGAWSPEVAVTRVVWQSGSGLARAPLLASATASGLCRVDWLLGRFTNNRFPYKDIEHLRREVEGDDIEEIEED